MTLRGYSWDSQVPNTEHKLLSTAQSETAASYWSRQLDEVTGSAVLYCPT